MFQNRSGRFARYIRRVKGQPLKDESALVRKQLLDGAFQRLQENLKHELVKQIGEIHALPNCANALDCNLSGNNCSIRRVDGRASRMELKFRPSERTVTLSCKKPKKFKYIVEVRLVNGEAACCLHEGRGAKELELTSHDLGWIVSDSLDALLGVDP